MYIAESFNYVRSDAKLDFQNAFPAQASQFVNLQVVPSISRGDAKGYISSVKIQSIQNLDWRIEFHSRRVSQASAAFYAAGQQPINSLLGYVDYAKATATAYATSFLYYTNGLKIPYLDEDNMGEIHVNMVANGTIAKLPGDTGAVHVAIGFISAA